MQEINIEILSSSETIIKNVLGYFCADGLKAIAHIAPHMISNSNGIDNHMRVTEMGSIAEEMMYLRVGQIQWRIEGTSQENYPSNLPMYKFILSKIIE